MSVCIKAGLSNFSLMPVALREEMSIGPGIKIFWLCAAASVLRGTLEAL